MLNPSWDDLTDELEHIRSRASLHAKWLAYEGSEAYGIWQLSPDLPEEDERRARFSLFAAHVIAKCGVLPVPVPKPLEHCPHWRSVCEAGSKRTAPRGVPRLLAELEHQKSRSHEGYRYPLGPYRSHRGHSENWPELNGGCGRGGFDTAG